jgi:hypothetical protein
MTHYSVRKKEEIKAIIDFVVSAERKIAIQIEGGDTRYMSRIILANYVKEVSKKGERPELTIERLQPERGNTVLQKNPKAVVKFSLRDKSYEFDTQYIGLADSQFSRIIMSYPESIRVTERREHERDTRDMPEFVSARFSLGRDDKTYELEVVDYSASGVGLLVAERDFDLLQRIKVGAKLKKLVLYAKWTTVMVEGTVAHKTKVTGGNTYVVGVRLDEILESTKAV